MKKPIKVAAYISLSALVVSGSLQLYETKLDHVHHYCIFGNIFGMEHQVDAINKYSDYNAIICPDEIKKGCIIIPASKNVIEEDGKERVVYTVPDGYTLIGNSGFREVEYSDPKHIEIYDEDNNLVNTFNKKNNYSNMFKLF